ncbi:MAG: hypothetical protein ACHQUC_08820 [Chlamydiales bacterium]
MAGRPVRLAVREKRYGQAVNIKIFRHSANAAPLPAIFMINFKILCDIDKDVNFIIGGATKRADIADLALEENIKRIYRIQFSQAPRIIHLLAALKVIESNPNIVLRFYGDYSEKQINWGLLSSVESLQVDLWNTKELAEISELTNLKRLGITKNVKSSVSLKILEPLKNLQILFTSISRDIQTISRLTQLHILSLSKIKTENLDFLAQLKKLNTVWLSLGSYENFKALNQIQNLNLLSIHQVRGFNDRIAKENLGNCEKLEALQLQDLQHIESLDFLSNLKMLKYLQIEGLKNIKTYEPVLFCSTLETFLATNSKPKDQSLMSLINVKSIGLGDSYSKSEIDSLVSHFRGNNISIRGRELKGKLSYANIFEKAQGS